MGLLDFTDFDLGEIVVTFVTNLFDFIVGLFEDALGL
jgi:hypothetical protein